MNPPINKYCVREVPGSHKAVILEGKISEYGIFILKFFLDCKYHLTDECWSEQTSDETSLFQVI